MILVICTSAPCRSALRIMGRSVEAVQNLVGDRSEWWPNSYLCTRCKGEAQGVYELSLDPAQLEGFSVSEIEAEEYFRFLMGVGLPEEHDCRIEVLQGLFRSNKVKNLAGYPIKGTTRFCLEWLELDDGTRLYFGASAHGATINRVVKKPDHVEQVKDHGG